MQNSRTVLTQKQIEQIHRHRMEAIAKKLEKRQIQQIEKNHFIAKAKKARLMSMRNEHTKLTHEQIEQIHKNRLGAIARKMKAASFRSTYEKNKLQYVHLVRKIQNTWSFSSLNLLRGLTAKKCPSFFLMKLQFDVCGIRRKLFFKYYLLQKCIFNFRSLPIDTSSLHTE